MFKGVSGEMSTNFTTEQKNVSYLVNQRNNLIVEAVAGAGKTTTCRCIAENFEGNILLLLYNKALAKETKYKFRNFNNILPKTIHSSAVYYYNIDASTDEGIIFLNKNIEYQPSRKEKLDLIIIDEAQDLNQMMVDYIRKLIVDFNIPQAVFLGDLRQSIYQFRGASEVYFDNAEDNFGDVLKIKNWERTYLSKSFRCPSKITNLVNKVTNIEIQSANSGGSIDYYIKNMFDKKGQNETASKIIEIIDQHLKEDETHTISDIAILQYSNRLGNTPLTCIANSLSRKGFSLYIPDGDQEVNDKLMRGKLVFSTFHAFKGRERKIIILLGMDTYLSRYFDNLEVCPNLLYVALTRCTQKLFIFQNPNNNPLPFLARALNINYFTDEDIIEKEDPRVHHVTSLLKFVPSTTLSELKELCEVKVLNSPNGYKKPKRIIKFNHVYEDVSWICGELVTDYHRWKLSGSQIISDHIGYLYDIIDSENYNKFKFINYIADCIELAEEDELKFLAFAINIKKAVSNNVVCSIKQIDNYDWIPIKKLKEASKYLTEEGINNNSTFEMPVVYRYNYDNIISGRMDVFLDETIYEIKFTSQLTTTHILQLAVYISLYYLNTQKLLKGILINTMSGEKIEVKVPEKNCKTLITSLMSLKIQP